MAFCEGYIIEQLNRVLTISKWLLVFFGIVLACVAIINQWLTRRIVRRAPRPEQRLKASEAELEATKSYAVCVHRLPQI